LIKEKHVKVVSHFDADGIASASIIIKMILREGVDFELRIVKQLTSRAIEQLEINEGDVLLLADLGSGQLGLLADIIERTQIFILDHHETNQFSHLNLFHINPLAYGEELSASMVSYLFAKSVNIRNSDLVDLAIVGATGDELDEKWEFVGNLARKIISEAETIGKISVTKGLRLYGRLTRPIHKALEYTFDPFIPGISGSESNAVQFLSDLGINIKENNEWRTLNNLSLEEQHKLASAIIIERLKAKHSDAEDIFGDIYTIVGRYEDLQDVREFATVLNAAGRLGMHDLGIRLCLDDIDAINMSKEMMSNYRRIISDGIEFIRNNAIVKTDFATYLVAKDNVPDALIGTITSIFLNSNMADEDKPIFGLAYTPEQDIKISARVSKDLNINLREVIFKVVEKLGGEAGGHMHAAGALITKDREKEFIEQMDRELGELIGRKG
jgi:RecJ-like exonuclease